MRIGKRNDPHYRIVVMPARSKRDGKAVEHIGHFNPRSKKIGLDLERAKYWLSVGAQPTDTIRSILIKHKLLEKKPRVERPALKPKKERKERGEKQASAAAPKAPEKEQPKEKKTDVKPEEKKEKTKEQAEKKEKKKDDENQETKKERKGEMKKAEKKTQKDQKTKDNK